MELTVKAHVRSANQSRPDNIWLGILNAGYHGREVRNIKRYELDRKVFTAQFADIFLQPL